MTTKIEKFMQSFNARHPLHQAVIDIERLGPPPKLETVEDIIAQAHDKVWEMLSGGAEDIAPLAEMLTDEQIEAITDKEDVDEVMKVLTFEQVSRLAFTWMSDCCEYYREMFEWKEKQLAKKKAKVAKLKKKIKA